MSACTGERHISGKVVQAGATASSHLHHIATLLFIQKHNVEARIHTSMAAGSICRTSAFCLIAGGLEQIEASVYSAGLRHFPYLPIGLPAISSHSGNIAQLDNVENRIGQVSKVQSCGDEQES